MPITTALTEALGIRHPVVLAAMGGSAGGELASAVSDGGGLGMLGGGRGGLGWLSRERALVTTSKPWGIGFLTWTLPRASLEWALEQRPHAIMLSFGDPSPFADLVHQAGVPLLLQVTDLEEARRARDLGASFIVAQGSEAGGHGGGRATLPFVPAVCDLVGPLPVLAAGGIADGRGLAAALSLGAAGAVIGTRYQACREAVVPAEMRQALVDGSGEDTVRTRVLDLASGAGWPTHYTARVVRNDYVDTWRDREDEVVVDASAPASVWAGEGLDLITDIGSAADLTESMAVEAQSCLRRALGDDRPVAGRT